MRVAVVSRFPRFDIAAWKRGVIEDLLGLGDEIALIYSRRSAADHLRAAWRERGALATARSVPRLGGISRPETLARFAGRHRIEVASFGSLGDADALRHFRHARYEAALLLNAELVPPAVLDAIDGPVLNVHYGLLPEYRGLSTTEWAILEDAPVGVTIHLVDADVDTGAVVERRTLEVRPGDDLAAIRAKQAAASREMLVPAFEALMAGAASGVPQGEGRRYPRMPPALRARVEDRLASGSYAGLSRN